METKQVFPHGKILHATALLRRLRGFQLRVFLAVPPLSIAINLIPLHHSLPLLFNKEATNPYHPMTREQKAYCHRYHLLQRGRPCQTKTPLQGLEMAGKERDRWCGDEAEVFLLVFLPSSLLFWHALDHSPSNIPNRRGRTKSLKKELVLIGLQGRVDRYDIPRNI